MSNWIKVAITFLVMSCSCAAEPHLFVGAKVGGGLLSVKPAESTSNVVTPLTQILGGNATPSTGYNKEALLEKSNIIKTDLQIAPYIGMMFPITNNALLTGGASIDFTDREMTVSNLTLKDKGLFKITRDINISSSIMLRASKQYSLGPVFEAHIVTSSMPIKPAIKEQDFFVYHIGFNSLYQFQDIIAVGMSCTTALDQELEMKDPAASNPVDIKFDYNNVKVSLSFLVMPI